MPNNVIEVRNLTRRFRKTVALDGISLEIQPGFVYGLVGANGQGKTTLIKHLLGLLRAKSGSVRVFGMDPVQQPVEVLERIGYLSEERDLPEWMRIRELLKYTAAFHASWDHGYADELMTTFGLDPEQKVKNLSKGMRAQVGLITAAAHRPELLLLDEPSTGLDAVVRKDILNEIIRAVADDNRTVVFSSHLLDEVELMSDHVMMINKGKLVLEGELDEIKLKHSVLDLELPGDSVDRDEWLERLSRVDGVLSCDSGGKTWQVVCNGKSERVREDLVETGVRVTNQRNASLQEIFVARVGRRAMT